MNKFILGSLLLSNIVFAATPQEQCKSNGVDYAVAKKFVVEFKEGLSHKNAKKLAKFMDYPVRVNGPNNSHYTIKSKASFIKEFPQLFNEQSVQAILNDNEIFCNAQGAMLGNGKIWYHTYGDKAMIFVIN